MTPRDDLTPPQYLRYRRQLFERRKVRAAAPLRARVGQANPCLSNLIHKPNSLRVTDTSTRPTIQTGPRSKAPRSVLQTASRDGSRRRGEPLEAAQHNFAQA